VVGGLVGTSLDDFSRNVPVYQENLGEKTAALFDWLRGLGMDFSYDRLQDVLNPGAAMKLAAGMLKGLSGVLTNAFLIVLTVIFILLEASSFPAKLMSTLKDPEASFGYFRTFFTNVQRSMAIKTLVSLATGAVIAAGLTVLGVDYPLLWGVLAFLLNYVPNIGSIIAAVPAVLLALIQLGTGTALLSASGYLVVNVAMGNVVEPRVMGRGLGLSTLVVFLSLVFWGWVLGIVGMLLAVPLTMTLKIAMDSNENTRWVAVLLGTEASALDAAKASQKEAVNEKAGDAS
jgi:predicted PurR-regulated permease PerM